MPSLLGRSEHVEAADQLQVLIGAITEAVARFDRATASGG